MFLMINPNLTDWIGPSYVDIPEMELIGLSSSSGVPPSRLSSSLEKDVDRFGLSGTGLVWNFPPGEFVAMEWRT